MALKSTDDGALDLKPSEDDARDLESIYADDKLSRLTVLDPNSSLQVALCAVVCVPVLMCFVSFLWIASLNPKPRSWLSISIKPSHCIACKTVCCVLCCCVCMLTHTPGRKQITVRGGEETKNVRYCAVACSFSLCCVGVGSVA